MVAHLTIEMKTFTRLRRLRYVVDWKLQGSLTAHGVVYGASVLAAIGFGIFTPLLWGLADTVAESGFEEQSIVMIYLHERFWLIALLSLIVVVIGTVRFSHRVAGPMVRYKRNLSLLADGKLPPPLKTRRTDFLKAEVEILNRAVAGVAARAAAIRRAQAEVARKADALAAVAGRGSTAVQQLQVACAELERAAQTFEHIDTRDDQAVPAALNASAPIGQPGGA